MTTTSSIVFSRLHFPIPLPTQLALLVLERLATDRYADGLILETRADADGIQHLLGCSVEQIQHLRRLLGQLIPGTVVAGLDGYQRPELQSAARLSISPAVLPLANHEPVRITKALYASLARRFKSGEAVALQVVLGSGRRPHSVPRVVADPARSWIWQSLTGNHNNADTETRNRVRDRAASFALDCTIRVGVASDDPARRKRFAMEVMSSLSMAETPGVRLGLVRETPSRINTPTLLRKHPLQLATADLLTVMGWPIGDEQLPGMPPAHPKLLRPASAVQTKGRVFARSLAPGDSRKLGMSAADALEHLFILGPTGVGKTSAIYHLVEADILAGHGVVVFDPKDQMPKYLKARIPKKRWGDVVHIDPSDPNPIGFNPLDATGRDPDVVADGVLAVFAKTFADAWGPRTEDIFSASLRTLARAATPEHPNTLIDLPRLWTDAAFRRSQLAQVSNDPGLMGFWSAYESLSPAAKANWIASPMNKLRSVLLRPAAVKILGQSKSRFRLRDTFRERKILLISLNEGLIGPLTAELIGSLILTELWQATQERASEKDAAKHPAYVYIDEADRFMHLSTFSLADALARSRSLSVGWTISVQHWLQMPTEMRSAVKSNARSKVVFALLSDEDADTFARLAPELTGQDFLQLDKYEVYANLVSDGRPTGWASAKTLPPSAAISDPDEVTRVSRSLYAPEIEPAPSTPAPAESISSPSAPLGMKKRRQS